MNKTRPNDASRALQLEPLDSESADMGGPVCEAAGRHYWPLERGANLTLSIKNISFPFSGTDAAPFQCGDALMLDKLLQQQAGEVIRSL